MKTYEKPLVMVNNDLAECVYAASGASSNYVLTRDYAGDSYNMYEDYWITFTDLPSSNVENQISVNLQVSGATVSKACMLTHKSGDAYGSGNTVTVNLNGWTNRVQIRIYCDKHDFTIR